MKNIELSSIVEASLSDVWQAWTTTEGVQGFFAPEAKIELKVGGAFELYFDTKAEMGCRGTEGMRIQTYVPERILAFDWCNPPQFNDIQQRKTWVVLEFSELDDELCEVTLTHLGWGEGPDWEDVHEFFCSAWEKVLRRFERNMRMGAIDWETAEVG